MVLEGGFRPYLWATIAYFLIFILFWVFVRTKKKLERWEGIVLLLIYIAFIIFEFWRINQSPASILFSQPIH